MISRGLRWQALQVSEKICAGDLPESRLDCACATMVGAAQSIAAITGRVGMHCVRVGLAARKRWA